MNYAVVIEHLKEHNRHRKQEQSDKSEQLRTYIHRHKSDKRGKPELRRHKLRLDYLAYNGYNAVNHKKPYAHGNIAGEEHPNCPRYQHRAGSENGNNVYHGGYKRNRKNIAVFIYSEQL